MSARTCPLCRARKGKRACPAKGELICAQCCGSQRRVQIACPDDCVYLTGAHAPAWEGRETERRRDVRRFASHLQPLDDTQLGLFTLALTGLGGLRARRRDLDDRRLRSALEAFLHTLETREKGVLYEHAPDDLRAVSVLRDLTGLFESSGDEGRRVAPRDRDLRAVLGALRGALDDTLREQAGPTAFLDTVTRLAGRLSVEGPAAPARPLIVEP
jgi:hypothetical protein